MSSLGWDNYALTIYFNQVINKPPKPHPIPEDWSIFISIASYRDKELVPTLKSMLKTTKNPERLHIVIYNQQDFYQKWDLELENELNKYI